MEGEDTFRRKKNIHSNKMKIYLITTVLYYIVNHLHASHGGVIVVDKYTTKHFSDICLQIANLNLYELCIY